METLISNILTIASTYTINRLKRIFAIFRIVFAYNKMNRKERQFIYPYALQIGFSKNNARKVVAKSTAMFTGSIDFEDYNSDNILFRDINNRPLTLNGIYQKRI